ncbi:peptide chain release factor 2 [Firmicutes bacterium CAG:449]|nr:peptide chain release factor 2 [Firmicutes bacterium CAG:449]
MILFDLDKLALKSSELDKEINSEHFWDNLREAQKKINQFNSINDKINRYKSFLTSINELEETYTLLKDSYDEELHQILSSEVESIEKEFNKFSIDVLLVGEYDDSNAIIDIHPGAGGTESQDWAEMLYRMYVRYAEQHDFKIQMIDYLEGDGAGLKSVSFMIKGKNVYGLLKSEKGVHRLVRISPFDASGRRHTSFASVEVTPEISNNIDITIDEKDLKIDTYRSSGAGGQNVNKTDSAVRMTHIPTGIVVTCQNERNQIKNRETALSILKSRLYLLKQEEQKKKISSIQGEQKNIEWGSQIRSYVFCPYKMVKDHRTNYETVDVKSVLDGNIDEFINAYLKYEVKNNETN